MTAGDYRITDLEVYALDKEYLEKRGIAWRNVAGYSTDSVAQHTFAMLFYLYEKLAYYDDYVKSGRYIGDKPLPIREGISGTGRQEVGHYRSGSIGKRVAGIAELSAVKCSTIPPAGKITAPTTGKWILTRFCPLRT